MLRFILLYFVFIYSCAGFAQNTISGKVVNKETGAVIAGATVYIDNTTIATSSNNAGVFTLKTIDVLSFNIVCSAMGYEVKNVKLDLNSPKDRLLEIGLVPQSLAIEEVEVTAFMKDGWNAWGKRFTESFIGSSSFAKHTVIKNPEVIRFRYNQQDQLLQAIAREPIQVVNKDLGYTLYYDLKVYELNIKTNDFYYDGSLRFESVAKPSKKIRANRKLAYQGSFMRFIRSTFSSNWEKDGYEVKELFLDPNLDREQAVRTLKDIEEIIRTDYAGNRRNYWSERGEKGFFAKERLAMLIRQPIVNLTYGKKLTEKRIISSRNQNQGIAYVTYKTALQVENKKIKVDRNYAIYGGSINSNSQLVFEPVDAQIEINKLGEFQPIKNWRLDGYFSWYNRMSTILPLDFEEQ